jgi:hypothetical protein
MFQSPLTTDGTYCLLKAEFLQNNIGLWRQQLTYSEGHPGFEAGNPSPAEVKALL